MSLRVLFCSAIFSLIGCACQSGGGSGDSISFSEDYFPKKWSTDAVLDLAGVRLNCKIELVAENQNRVIKLISNGVVVEEESYSLTTDGLSITKIGPGEGEKFSPSLPILKFPSSVGEVVKWNGKILIGPREIEAEAEIKTRTETTRIASGQASAIVSEINLKLKDGSPVPAGRRLTFWIIKGEGPIKRDFGNQIREPR